MNHLKIFLITLSVNLVSSQDYWETAIYASDEWRYHIPSEELPENWNSLDFDDNSWQVGIGGFGMEMVMMELKLTQLCQFTYEELLTSMI